MEIKKIASLFDNEFTIEIRLEEGDIHILGPFTKDEDAIKEIEAFELREFGQKGGQEVHKPLSPFDWVNAFYAGKNPFDDMNQGEYEINDKAYSQFMINRALTMNIDNAIVVADMFKMQHIDNYSHALYLSKAAKKPKFFSKWVKETKRSKKEIEALEEIKKEYNCSDLRAEEYLEILNAINNV